MQLTKRLVKTRLYVETMNEWQLRTTIQGKNVISRKEGTAISQCRLKIARSDLKKRKRLCSRSEGTLTANVLPTTRTEMLTRTWPQRRRLSRNTLASCMLRMLT